MPKLTPEQLVEIADREKNATVGPWRFTDWSIQTLVGSELEVCNFGIHNNDHCLAGDEPMEDDKIFIAASRTDIPALLDHIKALEEENARYKEALEQYANEENWTTHDEDAMCLDVWVPAYEHGYERAQNVLKGADEE